MSLIRRPLTGGSALGTPFAVLDGGGTVLHTFDNTGAWLGGPFPQRITLFVQNSTGGALTLTVTINGVSIAMSIASGAIVKIFDSQPMLESATSAPSTQIGGVGSAAGLVAWGFFETQT